MAAVLLLVFLPTLAAVGFILGTAAGELSWTSAFMGFTFVMLAGFLVMGAVNLSKGWDADGGDHGRVR
ncbi:MAG: hypothetical protein HOV81_02215 [Kofleriaceae bacterium]|nr:hypothetical protein [Kofleriaceae bacterium]